MVCILSLVIAKPLRERNGGRDDDEEEDQEDEDQQDSPRNRQRNRGRSDRRGMDDDQDDEDNDSDRRGGGRRGSSGRGRNRNRGQETGRFGRNRGKQDDSDPSSRFGYGCLNTQIGNNNLDQYVNYLSGISYEVGYGAGFDVGKDLGKFLSKSTIYYFRKTDGIFNTFLQRVSKTAPKKATNDAIRNRINPKRNQRNLKSRNQKKMTKVIHSSGVMTQLEEKTINLETQEDGALIEIDRIGIEIEMMTTQEKDAEVLTMIGMTKTVMIKVDLTDLTEEVIEIETTKVMTIMKTLMKAVEEMPTEGEVVEIGIRTPTVIKMTIKARKERETTIEMKTILNNQKIKRIKKRMGTKIAR